MKKKNYTLIYVVVVLAVTAGVIYNLSQKKNANQNQPVNSVTNSASPAPVATSQYLSSPSSGAAVLTRSDVMVYVSKNIASLSPTKPVLGGSWHVVRFWFASDLQFYAEYEDGHILRRILIEVAVGQDLKPSYKVKAYLEPGESDWTLRQGKDIIYGKPLDLYEYDQVKGWIKKN